jgi:hypothetical protein
LLFAVALETGAPVNRPTPPPPTRAPKTKTLKAPPSTPSPESTSALKPAETATTEEQALESPTTETPAPATSPEQGSDEDIAAMLLALQDEGGGGGLSSEVPDGSTVHDVTLSPEALAAQEGAAGKPKEDKNAKMNTANTAAAAKTILEKYMRRPRSKS